MATKAKSNTKKKKHGCLKAFLITLLVLIILIAVIIVVGLFVGNSIMKSNFGVGLFDAIGAVQDLGDYKEKDIVTNKFVTDDFTAFYDSVNHAMFFTDGSNGTKAVINSDFIKSLMDSGENNSDQPQLQTDEKTEDVTDGEGSGNILDKGDDGNIPGDGSEDKGGSGEIADKLLGLLDKNNFDRAALEAYNGTPGAEHISQISAMTDKQLGAFVNDLVFESGLTDDVKLGSLKLQDVMTFEQLILRNGKDMTDVQKEAYDVVAEDHAYLTMTCSIDTKKLVKETLSFLPGIAKWVIGWFVPKKTYLTLVVDLNDPNYGVNLEINSLSSKISKLGRTEKNAEIFDKYADADGKVTKMERIYIVVECIAGIDLKGMVNEVAGGVTGYLCTSESGFSVGNMIAPNTVNDKGEFKVDMYGLFASMLNGNTGGNATGKDVVVLMQSLICTDGNKAIEQAKGAKVNADNADEYGALFTKELEQKYILNSLGGGAFDDIVGYLTEDSDTPGKGIQNYLEEKSALNDDSNTNSTLEITDKMLSAMLYKLIKQGTSEFTDADSADANLANNGIELSALGIREETSSGKTYADMYLTINAGDMIPGENGELFGKIVPSTVTIGITVDITQGATDIEDSYAGLISYNELTTEGGETLNGLTVNNVLDSFGKIVAGFDFDEITRQYARGVRAVIMNLDSVVPSYTFVPTAA